MNLDAIASNLSRIEAKLDKVLAEIERDHTARGLNPVYCEKHNIQMESYRKDAAGRITDWWCRLCNAKGTP